MRLLLTGASGQLGSYLLKHLRAMNRDVAAWSGSRTGELFGYPLLPVELARADAVRAAYRRCRPDIVIHAAALSSVAGCYKEPARAEAVNLNGTRILADLAAESGARLVYLSTDMVFDGVRGHYREDDEPAPQSIYARTKLAAENICLPFVGNAIVRLSLLYGPSLSGRPSFFDEQIEALKESRYLTLFVDEWRSPLGLAAAAQALVRLAESDCTGLVHLGGPERLSRWEMGKKLALYLGLRADCFIPATREQCGGPEPRPRDVSLHCARWRALFPELPWPNFDRAIRDMDVA